MSLCRLNNKNCARVAKYTGIPFTDALAHSDGIWLSVRIGNGPNHTHLIVNRRTSEVIPETTHWSSCQ